ncbi:MAG: SDR family oxidoreductase [Sphingomonadales bacterium]
MTRMQMLIKIIKFYSRFTPSFSAIGYYWRAMFWSRIDPDFAGQTWLVTGGSAGIGQAIALEAARRGARVVITGRNLAKLDETKALAQDGAIIPIAADMALMADTAALLKRLKDEAYHFDVLVNNVGILLHQHQLTAEGKEASYALNILNHYLLTEGLLRQSQFNPGGTVINMTSGGAYNAPLTVRLMNQTTPDNYAGPVAYAIHKRGQMALTEYWQQTYGAPYDLKFYVMHPGWVDTDGVKTALPRFRKVLQLVLRNGKQGADTAIWLAATRPDCAPGALWLDRKTRAAHAYAATRVTKNTPQDLADFLAGETKAFLPPLGET